MEMSNNTVEHEVLIKQYLRLIQDMSASLATILRWNARKVYMHIIKAKQDKPWNMIYFFNYYTTLTIKLNLHQ